MKGEAPCEVRNIKMMRFDSFIFTSAGGREVNEDHAGSGKLPDGEIFIVADGLGGHTCGDVASDCIVRSMLEAPQPDGSVPPEKWLEDTINAANAKLAELRAAQNKSMKSTVAALAVTGGRAYWANVGDSRVYYFHRNDIEAITEDHSVAFKKFRSGEISRDMIGKDEDQSGLLRSLGGNDRNTPDVGCSGHAVESGDAFVLCSDGVWEYVRDEEFLIDLLKSSSAAEWADYVLMRLMERLPSNNDNLSLITVRVL